MYLNNVTSTGFSGSDADTRTKSPIDTVLNGDCIEVMRGLDRESVDSILTGPPYLVDYRSRDGRTIRNDADDAGSSRPFPKRTVCCAATTSASRSMAGRMRTSS
jgi:hypothetical protein